MRGLGFGEGLYRGIPVADIADRGVEGITERLLFGQPFGVVAGRAAAGDDLETFFGQSLANGGSDSTHTACDVGYFLTHLLLLIG